MGFYWVVPGGASPPSPVVPCFAASRAPAVFTQKGTALAHHSGFFHAQRNLFEWHGAIWWVCCAQACGMKPVVPVAGYGDKGRSATKSGLLFLTVFFSIFSIWPFNLESWTWSVVGVSLQLLNSFVKVHNFMKTVSLLWGRGQLIGKLFWEETSGGNS